MDAQKFKQSLLVELYKPYLNCTQCPLGGMGRTHVVFGEGNADAQLMFIGEGPGRDEDRLNRPFVGRSGQLLTKVLKECGLERSDVFITNIVKCRPPNNRAPTPLESSICTNLFLFKQIKIICPAVICTLGSTAAQAILNQEVKITKIRGKEMSWKNSILIPTYHPAYILRNPPELVTFQKDIQFAIQKTINK